MERKLKKKRMVLIFTMLIIFTFLLFGCASKPDQSSKENTTIEQWEYKVIQYYDQGVGPFYNPEAKTKYDGISGTFAEDTISSILQTEINKLGSEGWEMVSFTGDGQSVSTIMIFKRQK